MIIHTPRPFFSAIDTPLCPRFIMPIESGLFSTKQPIQGFGTSSLPGVLPLVAPGLFSHIPAIAQSRMVLRPVTGRLTLNGRLPIFPAVGREYYVFVANDGYSAVSRSCDIKERCTQIRNSRTR